MSIEHTTSSDSNERDNLLSYLSPEEKHRLVGSFVVDNFWETFNEENSDPISRFRDIAKESIPAFIEAYQDVWNFVVDINRLDDKFLSESIESNQLFNGLSPKELKIGNELLSLSLYSELEKDCLMALNKTILGELAEDLRGKHGFNDEEFTLLMTPSFETFFTKYHFDHLEYAITDDPELKEQQRNALIRNFHANDPALFELRFADMHFPSGDNVGDMLSMHKNALAERSAKKTAFIGDKEELIAFEKLLEYDNFLDFEYRYNLEACPEFYLRKKLFSACQENGIFTECSGPLSLRDSEFIDGVNALIDIRANKYIIEVNPQLDINNKDSFEDVERVRIEGSRDAILEQLKEGSPCVARKKKRSSSEEVAYDNVIIVGYDDSILLAQNSDKQYFELEESYLESLDEFHALRKYDKDVLEYFEQSTQSLIEREPYLDRANYEQGFHSN